MKHTVETVKQELPNVTVKIGKKTYNGKTYGRRNSFCTVVANDVEAEFSWATICRFANGEIDCLVF